MYYKVYDKDGSFKRTVSRAESKTGLGRDEYLKGVSCAVLQGGKIVVEIRSKNQDGGELLDFCSGHVDMEETASAAISRELQEELGIPKALSQGAKRIVEYPLVAESRATQKNWIMTFFLLKIPIDTELTLQADEVRGIKLMDVEEAIAMVRSDAKLQFPYDDNMQIILDAILAELQ